MNQLVRPILQVLASLLLVSVATGALVSKFYWGYWFTPPSVKPWVDELRSVDAVGYVTCEPGRPAEVEPVPAAEVTGLATIYLDSPAHFPTYQLLAALHAAGRALPAVTPTSDATQLLCDVLLGSRFIVDAEAGYQHARFIHGYVIAGTRPSNDRVVVLSALGGELSNDHHAVYDVEFIERESRRWEVLRHHQYFEDIAGLEGMRWFPIALLCGMAGLSLATVIAIGISLSRLVTRRARVWKASETQNGHSELQ